jgi:hypothetical protein
LTYTIGMADVGLDYFLMMPFHDNPAGHRQGVRRGPGRLRGRRRSAEPVCIIHLIFPNLTYGYLHIYRSLEENNNKIKTMQPQAYGFGDDEFFKLKILNPHETKYVLAKNNLLDGFTKFVFYEYILLEGNRRTARICGGVKARQGVRIKQVPLPPATFQAGEVQQL